MKWQSLLALLATCSPVIPDHSVALPQEPVEGDVRVISSFVPVTVWNVGIRGEQSKTLEPGQSAMFLVMPGRFGWYASYWQLAGFSCLMHPQIDHLKACVRHKGEGHDGEQCLAVEYDRAVSPIDERTWLLSPLRIAGGE
jgi:hypothetical protein